MHMRGWLFSLVGLVLAAANCAAQPLLPDAAAGRAGAGEEEGSPAIGESWSEPSLTPAQVEAEAAKLRAQLRSEVLDSLTRPSPSDQAWIARAQQGLIASGEKIDRPQLLVVVDRSPRVQALRIILARPDAAWEVIGGGKVSTGRPGDFDHFMTPVGVFPHTDAILDYRAEGTFNENHIRGLGLKGMRVWDFGWQMAAKSWTPDHAMGEMRLLMHATDPANLEHRIGRPASKGCIRIHAGMNRFIDRHGVLDFDYERAASVDPQYRAVLPPNRSPTPLAGDKLVVIDSSLSPAAEAVAIARRPPAEHFTEAEPDNR